MDFSLDPEQRALRDAVARFAHETWPADTRHRTAAGADEPASADAAGHAARAQRHRATAGLGLLGLALPEALGGSGLGATESMLVAQAFGAALADADWLASHVLAGQLLAQAASPAQQQRWLPPLIAGERRFALAVHEADGRYGWQPSDMQARRQADGWHLSGRKTLVLAGDTADDFLVVAHDDQGSGATLFVIAADAPGLRVQPIRLLDGRGAAHVHLDDCQVSDDDRVGEPGGAGPLLRAALARGEAALCAECAGAAEALLQLCVEHLHTRRQFGQPLAKFQSLQHRLADMAIDLEQIRSMACVAALASEMPEPGTRDHHVSGAKALTAQLSRRIALQAIQLHGAMGMTDECRASHLAKRLIANGLLFGDAAFHLRHLAACHGPQRPLDDNGDTP